MTNQTFILPPSADEFAKSPSAMTYGEQNRLMQSVVANEAGSISCTPSTVPVEKPVSSDWIFHNKIEVSKKWSDEDQGSANEKKPI